MYPKTSSRWCPTPEQKRLLEEMYRCGIRTPKAAQIQAITDHLSLYGNIEGKNVFYWFQNHKARDRQKLRRKIMMSRQNPNPHNMPHHSFVHHPQLVHYVPVQILPQDGSVMASPQMMAYSMKLQPGADKKCADHEPAIRTNDCDWTVTLDAGLMTKPMKTLELFPTTPSGGLKNGCITSSESAFSTSTN